MVLVPCTAAHVHAQGTQRCEALLASAQERYADGAFEEAEGLAAACLQAEDAEAEDVIRAYRLQTLALLRLQDLEASTAAVLKLLGVAPGYEPDPVQDPPDYVGLVRFVREQLRVAEPPSAPPAPIAPITQRPQASLSRPAVGPQPLAVTVPERARPSSTTPSRRPPHRVRLEGAGGANHYGGERSEGSGGPFEYALNNAGEGLQIGITYEADVSVGLGLVYEAGYYPTLLAVRELEPQADSLDRDASSPIIHQVSAVLRSPFVPGPVRPYAMAGLTVAISRLNDTLYVGAGPRVGVGVEGALSRRTALFIEGQSTLVTPGRVLDLVGDGGADFLSSLRVGVRYGL